MASIAVEITQLVDEQFPGFVECRLVDATGVEHRFVEKGPVVSQAPLSSESQYPQPGFIVCVIEREWIDEHGRSLVCANTDKPCSIESVAGCSIFVILDAQVNRE
ncbi:hypothetical protein KDM87_04470 [Undibacterium sp. FT147W]|uniref:Uncharacterized protein n=1 Tax=Undibacterium rivi TaxID=2828729 RepID=A0ABS5GZE5_9BURK|nr:hypothetical protein [Undibacterium rivi]MBR7791841.1 hypothetical protein [Undibacterium rivi]